MGRFELKLLCTRASTEGSHPKPILILTLLAVPSLTKGRFANDTLRYYGASRSPKPSPLLLVYLLLLAMLQA